MHGSAVRHGRSAAGVRDVFGRGRRHTARDAALAVLLTLAFCLLAAFAAAERAEAIPIPSNYFVVTDEGGANDVNSSQNDLTQFGRDDTDPTEYRFFWSWDATDEWSGNGQTGDACALFDTNNNTLIDYAVCVRINNPDDSTALVKELEASPFVFECNDSRDDRCGSPSAPLAYPAGAIQSGALQIGDPAPSPPANLITATDPFPNLDPDQNHPNDSTIQVVIDRLTALPQNAVLVNVCSYPSAGNGGNNNPFDCIVTPGGGFLVIEKQAPAGATQPFTFTVLPGTPLSPEGLTHTIVGSGVTGNIPRTVGSDVSVAEAVPADWTLTDATCRLSDGTTATGTRADDTVGSIQIESGRTTRCTFTNARETGTLEVVKDFQGTAAGRVNLLVDGTVEAAGVGDGGTTGADTVETGVYDVSETAGTATALADYVSSVSCVEDGVEIKAAAGTSLDDVPVGAGDAVTCTITNVRKATVVVRKLVDPAAGAPAFAFTSGLPATVGAPEAPATRAVGADGGFSLSNGDAVSATVPPGTYSVTEDDPRGLGYKLVSLSCSDEDSAGSVATRTATIKAGAGETVTCTYTNRKVLGQAVVVKVGDVFAYHGDTVTYTFSVTNSGNSPLRDVRVSDDKCPDVSAEPTSRTNDDGDAELESTGPDRSSPEVWVFTCSYVIGPHAAGEEDPIVNTAIVDAIDELDRPVTDEDTHRTDVLHQAVGIDKTGPATGIAGGRLPYDITVTNTGDTAVPNAEVVVTDPLCEAPPLLVGQGGDATPGTLDPGDRWSYTCTVQTAAGQTEVTNVARVATRDVNGRAASASDDATTTLTQPPAPPAPQQQAAAQEPTVAGVTRTVVTGAAKLRGPTGCAARTVRAVVTGRQIARVVWTVDGKTKRTSARADSQGRWMLALTTRQYRYGTHTLRAKVTFRPDAETKSRTLTMNVNRCRPVVKAAFTG